MKLLLKDLVLRVSSSLTPAVNENPSSEAHGIYSCEVDGNIQASDRFFEPTGEQVSPSAYWE